MANRNGGDWQEETYQKIKSMREKYFPELKAFYQILEARMNREYSLPQQQRLQKARSRLK
ncbi:unnamed protein product [Arabis nemorensis]|uniref:Uncharacterized protein n=1 Tax=Arabis nemorensis TaxID=586526 RepID=A0A565BRD5_9BRAS|nr:unnamed protein product [Arabis nemorensis]